MQPDRDHGGDTGRGERCAGHSVRQGAGSGAATGGRPRSRRFYANYIGLRLPWEVRTLFEEWLRAHFPDRAERVMNRVREMRGGKDYDASFATRMRGTGVWADLMRQRFYKAADRLGFRYNRFELDTSRFRAPPRGPRSTDDTQGSLF